MRKAMAGILPEKVQWRGGKISLAKAVPFSARTYAQPFVREALANKNSKLHEYFDPAKLEEETNQFFSKGEEKNLLFIWRAIVFSSWLNQANPNGS